MKKSPVTMVVAILFGSLVMFSSCQTAKKVASPEAAMEPPKGVPTSWTMLTALGTNPFARFGPEPQSIFVLSGERAEHKNFQIYQVDLASKREQRVTFQDGDNGEFALLKGARRLVYTSTTDEVKEDLKFIRSSLQTLNGGEPLAPAESVATAHPFEIYLSHLDGSRVQRLTERPGFDGFPTVAPRSGRLVFSSEFGGRLNLFALGFEGKPLRRLIHFEGLDTFPAFSPDEKSLAWVRKSPQSTHSDLVQASSDGRNAETVMSFPGEIRDLIWSPDREFFLFSSNWEDAKNFEIYLLKTDASCLQRLTQHPAQERSPELQADGKKLLFTSEHEGRFQVYSTDFVRPNTCLAGPPAGKPAS